MAATDGALPYHEADIPTILILTALLMLLNAINHILDRLVYCGLLGQIIIGVWFGTPGVQWLSSEIELSAQQLGYLGLILLVYEGGLNTNLAALKANLLLSSLVAITGIGIPIALSFTLQRLVDASLLQAFAAGAALCSTSLGTTFTVLKTSGLTSSRLGVVLTSAAMMDDVVGLVMVQIVSRLGESDDFSAATVARPVGVSVAFAVVVPAICVFVVAPARRSIGALSFFQDLTWMQKVVASSRCRLMMQTLLLVGMVAGASYAGTSGLFAAYLAGAIATWWDSIDRSGTMSSVVPQEEDKDSRQASGADVSAADQTGTLVQGDIDLSNGPSGDHAESTVDFDALDIYDMYLAAPVNTILKPFFFASIGFSIPISKMFSGSIVWRGIIYAILMAFAKLLCGAWLIRVHMPDLLLPVRNTIRKLFHTGIAVCWTEPKQHPEHGQARTKKPVKPQGMFTKDVTGSREPSDSLQTPVDFGQNSTQRNEPDQPHKSKPARRSIALQPLSLYPSVMLGSAMVARGEIGFLISSVAQSTGVFDNDLFLVVTWAIFLCTFAGPLVVGLLVRRVRRLQDDEISRRNERRDPLGSWGVSGTGTTSKIQNDRSGAPTAHHACS